MQYNITGKAHRVTRGMYFLSMSVIDPPILPHVATDTDDVDVDDTGRCHAFRFLLSSTSPLHGGRLELDVRGRPAWVCPLHCTPFESSLRQPIHPPHPPTPSRSQPFESPIIKLLGSSQLDLPAWGCLQQPRLRPPPPLLVGKGRKGRGGKGRKREGTTRRGRRGGGGGEYKRGPTAHE